VESCIDLEVQAKIGVVSLKAETIVEELAAESCFHLEAQAETGIDAALDT